MSALIEGLLAQTVDKSDEDSILVRAADLRMVCQQATARAQMIAIYEEMLRHSAEAMTTGRPNLDLVNVILQAISTR